MSLFKCCHRNCRSKDYIALFKCVVERLNDSAAKILSLFVISVIVACGKHISTEEDSAFNLFAESLRTGTADHIVSAVVMLGFVTETDTVISAEV